MGKVGQMPAVQVAKPVKWSSRHRRSKRSRRWMWSQPQNVIWPWLVTYVCGVLMMIGAAAALVGIAVRG